MFPLFGPFLQISNRLLDEPQDWFVLFNDAIEKKLAMSGKPVIKSSAGRCYILRKTFVGNCSPLRKKDGFDWDLFFYCYTKDDCPPMKIDKRGIESG